MSGRWEWGLCTLKSLTYCTPLGNPLYPPQFQLSSMMSLEPFLKELPRPYVHMPHLVLGCSGRDPCSIMPTRLLSDNLISSAELLPTMPTLELGQLKQVSPGVHLH